MISYEKAREKVLNILNEQKKNIQDNKSISNSNKEIMLTNILKSISHIDEVISSYIAREINVLCDEMYKGMDWDTELYFTNYKYFLRKRTGYMVDSDDRLVQYSNRLDDVNAALRYAIDFLELTFDDLKIFERKVPNHDLRDKFVISVNRELGTNIPLLADFKTVVEYSDEWKILMLRNGGIVTSQLINPMYYLMFEEDIVSKKNNSR